MVTWTRYLHLYERFVGRFPNLSLAAIFGIYCMIVGRGFVDWYFGAIAGKACVFFACMMLLALAPAAIATIVTDSRARRGAETGR